MRKRNKADLTKYIFQTDFWQVKKCWQITIFRYAYDSACVCCVLWPIKNVSDLYWIVCKCVYVCVLNGPFDFYPFEALEKFAPWFGGETKILQFFFGAMILCNQCICVRLFTLIRHNCTIKRSFGKLTYFVCLFLG